MVELQTLLPFITLLFLVVVELSNRLVEMDLGEISRVREGHLFYLVPDLGFFSMVHSLNVFLLTGSYMILVISVFRDVDYLIVSFLMVATGFFLFILPYLEIEEYDLFLHDAGVKTSLKWHAGMSFIILVEPLVFIVLGASIPDYAPEIGAVIFFLVLFVGLNQFLKHVRKEYRMADER